MPAFDDLWERYDWQEIPNCPGRFRLAAAQQPIALEELIGANAPVRSYRVPAARDEVLVVSFPDGGGLICYRRSNRSILHTLNTPTGLARKLQALGIDSSGSTSTRD